MANTLWLLADLDAGDIIKIVAIVIVFGIGFLNWAAMKLKKMAQPPGAPLPRPPVQARGPQAQAVDAEIEEFLRRAAQARGGQPLRPPQAPVGRPARPAPPLAGQPPRPAQMGRPAPQAPRPPRPASPFAPPARPGPARPPQAERPIEAEIVEPRRPLGAGVEQHVRQHLDTQEFTERAERLADHVEVADDAMEARIHRALDHRVGSLVLPTESAAATAASTEPASLAASVREMFADPASIRRVFIVQEILRRPRF